MTIADDLRDVAERLRRLAPCHRDPFRFHEDKSELVGALRRLAVQAETGNDNQPSKGKAA